MLQKYIHLRDYHRGCVCAEHGAGATSAHCLSFLSLSLSLAVVHQQAATNESKRACDTEGSVAGTF